MSGHRRALQKALYEAVSPLGFKTYDAAPQVKGGGGFPYVEIGQIVMAEFDTDTSNGFDYAVRVHVRSASNAMAETADIQDAIYDRLHNGVLEVDGYQSILIQRESSDIMRTAENTIHGVCEYRGLITKP